MTSLKRKRLAFMSIANTVKGFLRKVSGVSDIVLEDCVDDASLVNYTIYGNSVQNGTPTAQSHVAVESTGEYDEETGKYKIPVVCVGKNGRTITTDIYIDEPLRKVGDYADYIDFKKSMVVRQVGVVEFNNNTSYGVYYSEQYSFYGFFKTISNMKSGTRQAGFCTYLKNMENSPSSPVWFGVNSKTVYFSLPEIYNSSDSEKTKALKSWLQSLKQPFLLYYILETPTQAYINMPKLPTTKDGSIYSIGTQLQPSNIELSYYSTSKE